MNSFLLQLIIFLLSYGLYGILVGKLELSLPTYGFNYSIAAFVIVSVFYCFYNKRLIKSIPSSLSVFTIASIVSVIFRPNYDEFLKSFCCVIVPLVSYLLGSICFNMDSGYRLSKRLIFLYIAFLILSLLCLNQLIVSPENLMLHRDFTFSIIFFAPYLSILKNKPLKISLISVLLILIVVSVKRSVLLALLIFFAVYYFIDVFINKSIKKSKKMLWSVGVILVIAIGFSYFAESTYYDQLDERLSLLEEDGGSGRDKIYEKVYNGVTNADAAQLLIGHGYESVEKEYGVLSHNDLLEIAYDFGIIPLSIWICLILYFIKRGISLIKTKYYKPGGLMFATVLFWQILAETNCIIVTPEYSALIFIFLGIINQKNTSHAKQNISQSLYTSRTL